MATLRSYLKTEDAYLDAAFLGSMGIDANVVDARGDGGMAVGVAEPFMKVEVPDAQLEEARGWLARQEKTAAVVPVPTFDPSWDTASLHRFLKFLLIFDLGCYALSAIYDHTLAPVPPKALTDYLQLLALSEQLWTLAYAAFWPMYALSIISGVLCLFDSKTGRLLFAVTTVLGLLSTLGFPPAIGTPFQNFLGGLQLTASNIALALMYWSPVRQKFDRHRMPKG